MFIHSVSPPFYDLIIAYTYVYVKQNIDIYKIFCICGYLQVLLLCHNKRW
nr:MAG TPA: hypothetical protein [Caudoviricetes sp.]DAP60493.1 MAG TPA: hypothetical protein [Caudoviricetes sp.]